MIGPATAATAFAALLAVGTIWFDLLVFAVIVTITALVENDEGVWATIVFIGTVLSLQYISKIGIFEYMRQNPLPTLGYIGAYFAIGVGWTLVKWYFFVHRRVVEYNEFKRKFLKANNAETLTPELAAKLAEELRDAARYNSKTTLAHAPDPAEHKGDLTRWGTYWPFSMIGTALNDIVRRAWEYVYEMLQTTYQRMSNAIFRHATEDLKMAEEYRKSQATDDSTLGASRRNRGY